MYAIIETGGKQFRVSKGDVIEVERLPVEEGADVIFDRVLAIGKDNGDMTLGTPVVPGATARGKVLAEFKDDKVIVFKYKSKVNYRKKKGHRQILTKVRIEDISGGK